MKKDRMRELLTELRDREFNLKECYNLFSYIDDFVRAVEERSDNDNPNLNEHYQRLVTLYRTELETLLSSYALTDYTIDEFITYD